MRTIALIISLFLPPCECKDSENCYWDASARGNGEGQSFVGINGAYYPL